MGSASSSPDLLMVSFSYCIQALWPQNESKNHKQNQKQVFDGTISMTAHAIRNNTIYNLIVTGSRAEQFPP